MYPDTGQAHQDWRPSRQSVSLQGLSNTWPLSTCPWAWASGAQLSADGDQTYLFTPSTVNSCTHATTLPSQLRLELPHQ